MKIITDKNNIIIAISNNAKVVSNGIECDTFIIGVCVGNDGEFNEEMPSIYDVETVPVEVKQSEYMYDGLNFIKNPNYKPYTSTEQEVITLKAGQELLKTAMADLIMGGM